MKFCEYVEQLKEEVEKMCKKGTELKIQKIICNNGKIHTAINIIEREKRTSPVIHLDAYYEAYKEGCMSIRSAAEEVYNVFKAYEVPTCANIEFTDFETVRDKIIYQLVDYGRNKDMLRDMPYINYCDLAIVFCLMLGDDKNGCATAMIHNTHMRTWNVDTEKLYELAKANTPRLFPEEIKTMGEVLRALVGERLGSDFNDLVFDQILDESELRQQYVMTNCRGLKGAATVLYEGVLKKFADEINGDLFILPSSIHEVLLVPYEEDVNAAELGEMVKHINQTEVPEEDVLSDHVYFYSRETDQVTMIFGEQSEQQEQSVSDEGSGS